MFSGLLLADLGAALDVAGPDAAPSNCPDGRQSVNLLCRLAGAGVRRGRR